ncbi:MAG: hypothetical protein CVV25_14555, partial [Ignavibacteriae bacterium HGW-Ignavibacteriae-4]
NLFFALAITLLAAVGLDAQWETKGDTIIVQTLSYDSITTRSGTWEFPPADSYEKILMHYSLKCDPRTAQDGFNCGEWDYLTYTVVTDSSGMFDSTSFAAPNFLVRGTSPNKYYYTTEPYNYKENETIYNTSFGSSLTNRIEVPFNSDENGVFEIMPTNGKAFFVNMLFSNSELESFRNAQGDIHAIKLKFLKDVKINNFRIRLKNTSALLPNDVLADQQESYLFDIDIKAGDTKEFVLYSPFKVENDDFLSIAISGEIEQGTLSLQSRDNEESIKSRYFFGSENYIQFSEGSYIDVPKKAFADLGKEITIAFWQNGDNIKMPQNSYAFEGVNSKGQRVVNSHLPWSNGQVYWDAGNAGGSYDRISKQATGPQFKGEWNYWTFTKNTESGDMKIYLNGEEWHSGTALTRGFDDIEIFKIASNATGYGRYDGSMDNFAVWNRVLTANEIADAMKVDYQTNKGQSLWNGLLFYYDMNNIVNNNIPDVTGNGNDGTAHGFPEVKSIGSDNNLVSDNNEEKFRPVVTFVKGEFSDKVTIDKKNVEVVREYPVPKDEVYLFDYDSPNRVIPASELKAFSDMIKVPTMTLTVYPANKPFYTYSEFGDVIDSVVVAATDSLIRDNIMYYSPVVDYEIHRFITPYGINLDLGPDGFTWVEDVSDFEPLLHGNVNLRAGNQQELIDLKFLFIKGTPARTVKSVQTLWSSGGNYVDIVNHKSISEIEITPNKNATMFKAKTRASGHGFAGPANTDNCSEFCKRTHRLYVGLDGQFEWEGWKECGDNPVFPQGGTWQIDRSDWCPGATVNTYDHEITTFVTPGVSTEMDYEIDNPSQFVPYGNYIFTGYMIGYGNPNFVNDASIERIISPSIDQEYGRLNPSCTGPVILIKNNGSEELSSLNIEYGVLGKDNSTYNWSGKLGFLEETKITLPPLELNSLNGGTEYNFEVRLSNPNGKDDENTRNDYATSKMIGVDVLSKDFKITLKTNRQAEAQYRMKLTDASGRIIKEVKIGDFGSVQSYNYEFDLEIGCYELLFENVEGFGLDLWWMRDQLGTGYISISSGNKSINFNPDFGNFIKYQFSVGEQPEIKVSTDTLNFGDLPVGEKREKSIFISPKNAKGLNLQSIEMGFASSKGITLVSPTVPSKAIYIPEGESQEIVFQFEAKDDKAKSATVLLKTDSQNNPAYKVILMGNTGISSVKNNFDNYYAAEIVSNGKGNEIRLTNKTNESSTTNIDLYDIKGKLISRLYDDLSFTNSINLPINVTFIESGVYLVRLNIGSNHKDLKFINIK